MDALPELHALVSRLAKRRRTDPLARLHLGFATAPTRPTSLMTASTLALVVQGEKRTGLGARAFDYGTGHVLITSVTAPLTTQITRASMREPFLGVGLTLEPAFVAEVLLKAPPQRRGETPRGVVTSKASDDLLDAIRRFVRLLESPEDIPLLADAIEREILWRVIQSPQGAALRESGLANSNSMRVSRAIDLLRTRFTEPLPVSDLARAARMSVATFHRHFLKVTAMTPIQFQKQLRLQEARSRLLARAGDVRTVSFAVGYQSASQFSRDYRRQFGLPPGEDAATWQDRARSI